MVQRAAGQAAVAVVPARDLEAFRAETRATTSRGRPRRPTRKAAKNSAWSTPAISTVLCARVERTQSRSAPAS